MTFVVVEIPAGTRFLNNLYIPANGQPVTIFTMRWHSTPESAYKGEITRLALIECVIAVALYIGFGLYFKTFIHLAAAIAVAPMMLLRTELSAEWGLAIYARISTRIQRCLRMLPTPESGSLASGLLLLVLLISTTLSYSLLALFGSLIRVVATLYWALRRPFYTLKAVPQNWVRQSFCTDFFHPPEIVPLEAYKGSELKIPTFAGFARQAIELKHEPLGIMNLVINLVLLSPFLALGYVPSLIYRISFKATTLAYAPLIWITRETVERPLSTTLRLQRIEQGELENARRALARLIATVYAAKIALAFGWVESSYLADNFPTLIIFVNVIHADTWPWWQVTLGLDALLTYFLRYFADAALARLETADKWSERMMESTISTVSLLRSISSFTVISYFFYVALIAAVSGF